MTGRDDLQADLDEIADDLDRRYTGQRPNQLVDRLRHLLDGRDLSDAPWTSEIIAHLEAGGTVQQWSSGLGAWGQPASLATWRGRLTRHGDQRQHGYRLGALPPATERVLLHRVPGRILPGQTEEVFEVHNCDHGRWAWAALGDRPHPLDVAGDGTVEVLR